MAKWRNKVIKDLCRQRWDDGLRKHGIDSIIQELGGNLAHILRAATNSLILYRSLTASIIYLTELDLLLQPLCYLSLGYLCIRNVY